MGALHGGVAFEKSNAVKILAPELAETAASCR